jgi:hypothetical protein
MMPLCFGLYKDSKAECQECKHMKECSMRLVLNILEGTSQRPSAIMTLEELEDGLRGAPTKR